MEHCKTTKPSGCNQGIIERGMLANAGVDTSSRDRDLTVKPLNALTKLLNCQFNSENVNLTLKRFQHMVTV